MEIDPCTIDGAWPFEGITITRLKGEDGEPNGLVEIEGEREGSARWVTIPYERVWGRWRCTCAPTTASRSMM